MLARCASVLVDAYNAEPWNDSWTQEKALEKLECFYSSPKFIGFIAVKDQDAVGALIGNIEPYYTGDYFYLKEMFVSSKAQKRGIGKTLMQTLKTQLGLIDIRQVVLFTSKDHFPFDFYQKARFNTMDGMCMMHFESGGIVED